MAFERIRMQVNSSDCRFTLIWSHFDFSLASRCQFDPTSESKRLLKSKRHIGGVKITLPRIVLKRLHLLKTTVLNLQCALPSASEFEVGGGWLILKLISVNSKS